MVKSILFVVNDPRYFMSHRLPIAMAAREEGYVVHVASIAGYAAKDIKDLGFFYHTIDLERGGMNVLQEACSFYLIVKLLWRIKPDILHLITLKPVIYGGIAARLAPVGGVVSAVAGMGSLFIADGYKHNFLRSTVSLLYRIAFGKKNLRAIFQNPDDRDLLVAMKALSVHKTVLIRGSGVELDNYKVSPEPSGPVVVTFAGRLLRDKGVREFIEAASLLKTRGVVATFQLVGDVDPGNPTSISDEDIIELRRKGDVTLMGYRGDIPCVFAASHIIVLPSYREGLPKVLIEAAACGRAVVTTDVPGCRDAIEPGVTGILVAAKDAKSLAAAIDKLIQEPNLRKLMGSKGRELAEQAFSIQKVVRAHLDVYEELRRGG